MSTYYPVGYSRDAALNYKPKETQNSSNENIKNIFTTTSPDNSSTRRQARSATVTDLTEKLEQALKNQSPYIQGLESRIKELEEAKSEEFGSKNELINLNAEYSKCKEDLAVAIHSLSEYREQFKTISTTESHFKSQIEALEKKHAACEVKLEFTTKWNTTMQEQLHEYELQLKNMTPNLKKVVSPTANDLSQTLLNLELVIEEVKKLGKSINDLRDEAQKTCKIIKSGEATVQILQDSLKMNDSKEGSQYDNLCIGYELLRPSVLEAQKHLQSMIEKATHLPVPEQHIKAISAKNYLPLNVIEDNDKAFENILEICRTTLTKLKVDFDHIGIRYDDTTGHLNQIDHKLSLLTTNSSFSNILGTMMGYQAKTRISPTSSYYVSKIIVEEEEEKEEKVKEAKEVKEINVETKTEVAMAS